DKKLIEKFRAGKCSSEEVRKILLWYQSEEAEISFSLELENYWNEEDDLPFGSKDEVYHQIRKKIWTNESEIPGNRMPVQRPPFLQKKPGFKYLSKIIAVFILLLLSIPLFYFRTALFENPPQETKINWMIKETAYGQKYTIKLPDGTLAKLNSGSMIRYPEFFSDSLRLVEFEGEAFFEVA